MKTTHPQKYGLAGFLQFHEIHKNRDKKLLIFKTDIKTKKKVNTVKSIFNNDPNISDWSIDIKDIDNVLRIETDGELMVTDVINRIRTYGFYCEVLVD